MWNTKIIDINDDNGELLKSTIDFDELPEVLKTAQIKQPQNEEEYALVIEENEYRFPKFACNNPENTSLSFLYFLHNYDKLTEDQIKTAATNLADSMNQFNLETPKELKALMDEIKSVKPSADVRTRTRMKTHERLYTEDTTKTANNVILDKYPVDTYDQVEMAKNYFKEYLYEFSPEDRRKFASELKDRIDLLKISSIEEVENYGSKDYGNIDPYLYQRKNIVEDDEKSTIDMLLEKKAYVSPDCFAEALKEFDLINGLDRLWDRTLKDPYYSTFNKTANVKSKWTYKTDSGAFISEGHLDRLAQETQILRNAFDNHFADLFMARPKDIFEKAPENIKKILVRLAEQYYAI